MYAKMLYCIYFQALEFKKKREMALNQIRELAKLDESNDARDKSLVCMEDYSKDGIYFQTLEFKKNGGPGEV